MSDPLHCQYIWDAISTIRFQKKQPTFERIRRYLCRWYDFRLNDDNEEIKKIIDDCLRDHLILIKPTVGRKGSMIGVQTECFKLPPLPTDGDLHINNGHDWYCFKCHKSGSVIGCANCGCVYHDGCIDFVTPPDFLQKRGEFVCGFCCKINSDGISSGDNDNSNRKYLNRLLSFIVFHFLIKFNKFSQLYVKEPWRGQLLLHRYMDLEEIQRGTVDCRYESIHQFEKDVFTILHNISIYQGDDSSMANIAREMLKDCQFYLRELEQCRDCFFHSNEKLDDHWFCQPCRPPHKLVFAKQKGFPYWPAKVMKENNDNTIDVRFFGSHHDRALIVKSCVIPISLNPDIQAQTLSPKKKTTGWMKAFKEMEMHLDFLSSTEGNNCNVVTMDLTENVEKSREWKNISKRKLKQKFIAKRKEKKLCINSKYFLTQTFLFLV